MKKTRAILISILLIALAFTSCNLDGTTGIFREIAQSKAPLSVRYKQLLGYDATPPTTATYHYYWTSTGIYRFDSGKNKETIALNPTDEQIHGAAFSPADKVFFITNNETEQTNGTIYEVNTSAPGVPIVTPMTSTHIPTTYKITGLYPNSMIMLKERDDGGEKFELLQYQTLSGFFGKSIPFTFTTNHGLHAVIQQTAKAQTQTEPIIVSFAKGINDYKHFIVDPSSLLPIAPIHINQFDNETIANFMMDATNLYILTTDGKLYFAGTPTLPTQKKLMKDSGKVFAENTFALPVDDGTKYHFITKSITSGFYVFTFDQALPAVPVSTGAEVKTGYAKHLVNADIVSAQIKSSIPNTKTNLLIATDKNGMFDIIINHNKANIDNATNGNSSEAEAYTF